MTRAHSSRLISAVLVAVSIHAAAATGILLHSPTPDPATDQGDGGVMLLIATTAAGSSATPEPATETPTQAKREEPAPEKTPTEPKPNPETVKPQKQVQRIKIEKQSRLKTVVQADRDRKATSPRPRPVPLPKRKPVIQKRVAEKEAIEDPLPHAADRRQKSTEPTTSEADIFPSVATNGNNGISHQTQIAKSSGGKKSKHGAYLAAVRNWLHEHKRYPRRARLRMMRGEAVIGFVLDRSGRVVSYELRRSTGHGILDREVLAMVRRASPMPSFPPNLTRERMNFSLPVLFDIH